MWEYSIDMLGSNGRLETIVGSGHLIYMLESGGRLWNYLESSCPSTLDMPESLGQLEMYPKFGCPSTNDMLKSLGRFGMYSKSGCPSTHDMLESLGQLRMYMKSDFPSIRGVCPEYPFLLMNEDKVFGD